MSTFEISLFVVWFLAWLFSVLGVAYNAGKSAVYREQTEAHEKETNRLKTAINNLQTTTRPDIAWISDGDHTAAPACQNPAG